MYIAIFSYHFLIRMFGCLSNCTFIYIFVYVPDKVSFVLYIHPRPGQPQPVGGPHLKYDVRDLLGSGAFASVHLYV